MNFKGTFKDLVLWLLFLILATLTIGFTVTKIFIKDNENIANALDYNVNKQNEDFVYFTTYMQNNIGYDIGMKSNNIDIKTSNNSLTFNFDFDINKNLVNDFVNNFFAKNGYFYFIFRSLDFDNEKTLSQWHNSHNIDYSLLNNSLYTSDITISDNQIDYTFNTSYNFVNAETKLSDLYFEVYISNGTVNFVNDFDIFYILKDKIVLANTTFKTLSLLSNIVDNYVVDILFAKNRNIFINNVADKELVKDYYFIADNNEEYFKLNAQEIWHDLEGQPYVNAGYNQSYYFDLGLNKAVALNWDLSDAIPYLSGGPNYYTFYGKGVWNDGQNLFYSYKPVGASQARHFLIDTENYKLTLHMFNDFYNFVASDIFNDLQGNTYAINTYGTFKKVGNSFISYDIGYSDFTSQSGANDFWNDGTFDYYSNGVNTYKLVNGQLVLNDFNVSFNGRYIWKAFNNVFYSYYDLQNPYETNTQYILKNGDFVVKNWYDNFLIAGKSTTESLIILSNTYVVFKDPFSINYYKMTYEYVTDYYEGFEDGFLKGYQAGYNAGYYASLGSTLEEAYQQGYNAGLQESLANSDNAQVYDIAYNIGYRDGLELMKESIYSKAFNDGYNAGFTDGSDNVSSVSWIVTLLSGLTSILSLQILPGFTLSTLIMIPMIFGVFWFFLKLIKGGD